MNCGLYYAPNDPIHTGVKCDGNGCGIIPIKGNRFKCITCPDFDFCGKCKTTDTIHTHHKFKKVHIPSFIDKQPPVPLSDLKLTGYICGNVGSFQLCQTYINEEPIDIEAVYVFPLNPRIIVQGFKIEIDDKIIEAKIQEKEKAQNQYDDAIAEGNGAYLLERSKESHDIFTMNIGRLPSGKSCVIKIDMIGEMDIINANTYRLIIPSIIFPRYNTRKFDKIALLEEEKLLSSQQILNIDIKGCFPQNIRNLHSPSHSNIKNIQWKSRNFDIQCIVKPEKDIWFEFVIEQATEQTQFQISTQRGNQIKPGIYEYASCISLVPIVPPEFYKYDGNYIFLVDCSGSMSGEKMNHTKMALRLLLRCLTSDCIFNIICFESNYRCLFPESKPYNEDTFNQASIMIDQINASGGTELSNVLRFIMNEKSSRMRMIFLLTDGEVSDTTEIIEIAAKNKSTTRFFTLGVGEAPSRALVEGVARASKGVFDFVIQPSQIEEAIMKQWNHSIMGYFKDIKLIGNEIENIVTANATIPYLLPNIKNIFYVIFTMSESQKGSLKLEMSHNYGSIKETFIQSCVDIISTTERSYFSLAARDLISAYESNLKLSIWENLGQRQIVQSIIGLSIEAKILSPYTAFIAIEKRKSAITTAMELRKISIQKPQQRNNVIQECASFQSKSAKFITANRDSCAAMISSNGSKKKSSGKESAFRGDSLCFNSFTDPSIVDLKKQIPISADPLMEILKLQNWDGTWTSIEAIEKLMGKSKNDMKNEMTLIFGLELNNASMITIINVYILIYISTHFKKKKIIWKPIYEKGINYLLKKKILSDSMIKKITGMQN